MCQNQRRRNHRRDLPPEWEIDPEVVKGMSGGYRRIKDGLRLQRHARLGVWILLEGRWATHRTESPRPPLQWADGLVPMTSPTFLSWAA